MSKIEEIKSIKNQLAEGKNNIEQLEKVNKQFKQG
jgi:hypothetical protein